MTEGAVEGIFDVSWKFPRGQKKRDSKIIFTSKYNGALLNAGGISLIKLYPKLNKINEITNSGEWAGNGSGIIISKSGYIVTNYHVIKDANDIEVEFILNDEVKKFNAEIVQVDKTNDLAIIKIFDMNFDGLDDLPYNFKSRSSDVGTKVYAYGYPMALSLMGKEIKITDGIISSKTGFDGNVTTYQITAPIQGGNSGGPLFDDKGNFLGINSSGLRKDVADNVGYTIKSSYVMNLLDVLPKTIDLPSDTKLQSISLTEQIKEISKFVVLVKVK
jgi:serine protease Do